MSTRQHAIKVADHLVRSSDWDVERAVEFAETDDLNWWEGVFDRADVPDSAILSHVIPAVRTILADRAQHPDPFEGFPNDLR